MKFLLELPLWLGLFIVVCIITISGLIVVTQVKKRIQHKLTKQHVGVGRILFRVTAGLIALLISLSFANERMEQYKIIDSMEMEASYLVNVAINLNMLKSAESVTLKENIIAYVNSTIEEQWENVQINPFYSNTSKFLVAAKKIAYQLPVRNRDEDKIKNDIIEDLNQAIIFMQVRIYSQNTLTPYLIYILFLGLIIMWVFFTVYNLDIISLTFLSLYNIFIAVLIYVVFMMSNPLIGPLKIDAHSFSIIKTKGIDFEFK